MKSYQIAYHTFWDNIHNNLVNTALGPQVTCEVKVTKKLPCPEGLNTYFLVHMHKCHSFWLIHEWKYSISSMLHRVSFWIFIGHCLFYFCLLQIYNMNFWMQCAETWLECMRGNLVWIKHRWKHSYHPTCWSVSQSMGWVQQSQVEVVYAWHDG